MRYMLLIHHGDTPTPDDPEAWARLSEEEQKAVYLGRRGEAPEAYLRALALVHDDAERRLLERRLAELGAGDAVRT
ncbi:MAG TPA: hypothetical protein VG294_18680 [Solirubrobacteraceae bacterium]|nr:hypothetical protein [Solirubrobacteraceae bacterium]